MRFIRRSVAKRRHHVLFRGYLIEPRLQVIESGTRSRSRTLGVLSACEYRGCLTQQRIRRGLGPFWPAPAVTLGAAYQSAAWSNMLLKPESSSEPLVIRP